MKHSSSIVIAWSK